MYIFNFVFHFASVQKLVHKSDVYNVNDPELTVVQRKVSEVINMKRKQKIVLLASVKRCSLIAIDFCTNST